jgi:ADP-dependent NAD(P)H-hydrate dehydratase / NAD(P)H-hydrate epimerase
MSGHEILTVAEMAEADKLAVATSIASLKLMENAGRAVADEIEKRWTPRPTVVLCGPGNNGGDGYVCARHLKDHGWDVWVETPVEPASLTGDAATMFGRWQGKTVMADKKNPPAQLIVDAMFGAGLSRPLEGSARGIAKWMRTARLPCVAIDVPSGIHGDTGRALEEKDATYVRADVTVTFFRKKPAHVLLPQRLVCGEIVVADIGIPDAVLETIHPRTFENAPGLWSYPWPDPLAHKYARGHAVVVSGPAHATGAARLAARGALRVGAGLVSVASPQDAVAINAAQLTAIMVKPFSGAKGLAQLLSDKRLNAVALGPGLGVGAATQDLVAAALASDASVVLDADALTSFASDPAALFRQLRPNAVLTPHEGEFERIFPGVLKKSPTRLHGAREAAATAKCIVLLKGPDTIVAAPDGRAAINTNAPVWLATAGSGDVLTGMIAGLLAQSLQPFEAACAGAWLHGAAAQEAGIGMIAEDIPEALPAVLRALKHTP